MTSAPCDWRIRRMMLIEASWPSNRLAAVTKRTGWTGTWRGVFVAMAPEYSVVLLSVHLASTPKDVPWTDGREAQAPLRPDRRGPAPLGGPGGPRWRHGRRP